MKMSNNYNNYHWNKIVNTRYKKKKKRSRKQSTSYNNERINVQDVGEFSDSSLNNINIHKDFNGRSKKQTKTVPLLLHSHSENLNVHNDTRDELSRISLNSKIRYLNRTRDEENASELIYEEDPSNSTFTLVKFMSFSHRQYFFIFFY